MEFVEIKCESIKSEEKIVLLNFIKIKLTKKLGYKTCDYAIILL